MGPNVVGFGFAHLYLSFHGDAEKCDEVHDQDWPEDRYVEELKEGAEKGDHSRLSRRVPKLELGQPSEKNKVNKSITSYLNHGKSYLHWLSLELPLWTVG